MNRVTTKLRSLSKPNEEGSFKFAISLIIACLTVIYKIKNYTEYNLLSSYVLLFMMLVVGLSVSILVVIGLSIFFKAMSLETNDYKIRKNRENLSKKYYIDAFNLVLGCGFLAINFIFFFFIPTKLFSLSRQLDNFLLLLGISCLFTIWFLSSETCKQLGLNNLLFYNYYDQKRTGTSFYISFFLFFLIMPFIFTNYLIINVDSVYYNHNQQIPLDISLTGVCSPKVYVNLYQGNFEHLVLIDSIKMQKKQQYMDQASMDVCQSDHLRGNYLGLSKFKVFINCSNLTEGYYVISVANWPPRDNWPNWRQDIISHNSTNSTNVMVDMFSGYLNLNKEVANSFYLIEN